MSILYCTIPFFATALARREHPDLPDRPLVLIGPEERVFAASAEAVACGVVAGMATRVAQMRCPQACLSDADVGRCQAESEAFWQVLEQFDDRVEAHGWGAAYVDLRGPAKEAVAIGSEVGRAVRRALGEHLQPALGWDTGKFTAQAAARRTRPGRMRAVPAAEETDFLRPLPVGLLPLAPDVRQRLSLLGLRTLGQFAALSPAAVLQQFGRAGTIAHRLARGQDERPVIPRWQAPHLTVSHDFDALAVDLAQVQRALARLIAPLCAELHDRLQACGALALRVHLDDGRVLEKQRIFFFPTADEAVLTRAADALLETERWTAPAVGLSLSLERIQEVAIVQLALFPAPDEPTRELQAVQRYLAARFGASRLRRAALLHPHAPLAEWRAGWLDEGQG